MSLTAPESKAIRRVASVSHDTVTVFESQRLSCAIASLPAEPFITADEEDSASSRSRYSVSSSGTDGKDDLSPLLKPQAQTPALGRRVLHVSKSPLNCFRLCHISPCAMSNQLYVAIVIIFFAGSSLGAIFINKTCLTGYNFRYPFTLMLGQMAFTILVLGILHTAKYLHIPPLHRNEIAQMALPSALFISNVFVGLNALSLVNIPMFSAFRRLTLLFVMGAEFVFLKKSHSPGIVCSIVVMTFGAFISAIDDVSFSRLGYSLVFLNNLLTALYLASIKKVMKQSNFQPLHLLYYTALMGLPVVVILTVTSGELRQVYDVFQTRPELTTPAFFASLVIAATGAFAVNFSTSLCTHVTSPLTTSVAGQVKNVLQTVLGFFSWGFVPTTMNIAGLLVALGAQVAFAYIKFAQNREEQQRVEAQRSALEAEDLVFETDLESALTADAPQEQTRSAGRAT
jgi:Triose-phosphate Transporter family